MASYDEGITEIATATATYEKLVQQYGEITDYTEFSDSHNLDSSIYNIFSVETIKVRAIVILSFLSEASDLISISESTSIDKKIVLELLEKIVSTGTTTTTLHALNTILEVFSSIGLISTGKGAELSESVDFVDDAIDQVIASLQVLQVLSASDASQTVAMFSIPVTEGINTNSVLNANSIIKESIDEGVSFYLSIRFASDELESFSGWVMNTKNFSVSNYDNYPFNSFAKIADHYYGANQNGLYRLDGTTDDGEDINANIIVGLTDLGDSRTNRLRSAHIGLRSDGDIVFRVISDDNTTSYFTLETSNEKLSRHKIPIGRTHSSTYWQFELTNKDGSDFELSEIIFIPIVLNRRG